MAGVCVGRVSLLSVRTGAGGQRFLPFSQVRGFHLGCVKNVSEMEGSLRTSSPIGGQRTQVPPERAKQHTW